MNNLPASTGWDWLKQGTGLFRKQPAALTTLLFANILISIALSAVPFIGPVLAVVLVPSFSMAFMQACLMIENGARVTPAVLLTGFRQPALASLCKVGLIYFAVAIVLMIITQLLGIQELVEKMSKAAADPKNPPEVSAMDMLPLFGLFLLDVAIMVTLCFTAPLTYWKHMGPGKAAFYSFFAVVRTARVFLVMLVSWFALFLGVMMVIALVFGNASIGRVVMIWLMFLFVLLLQCAMYAGYRTIFGKPSEKDMQPA